jgi:hypothetical protein
MLFFSCSDNQSIEEFVRGEEPKSIKGNWIEADKSSAREYIEDAIRSDGSDPSDFPETIDCVVKRLEIYYVNFEEAEFDEEGLSKIFAQCFLKELKNEIRENNSQE